MYWVMTTIHIILVIVAFVIGAFLLWRSLEREHVDELPLFVDRLLISVVLAQLLSKVPYLLLNFALFLRDPVVVLRDSFSYAANEFAIPLFLVVLFLSLQSVWKDRLALLDYIVSAISLLLGLLFAVETVFGFFGLFFVDATPATYQAIIMSGVGSVFFFILARALLLLEQRYRTFFWYRYRRSSAQSGFVLAVFISAFGIYGAMRVIALLPFSVTPLQFAELLASLIAILSGFIIIYVRSGRLRLR